MKIRLRRDLLFYRRDENSGSTWVVKDPLTFEYFLFSDKEVFLLRQLDGLRSESEILEVWRSRFRSALLSADQLRQFVKRLVQDNLVIVDRLGYGNLPIRQQQSKLNLARGSWFSNPMAIRFRGINPTGLLKYLDWLGWLMFHPAIVCIALISAVLTLFYMFGHFEDVAARIPAIEFYLTSRGLIGVGVTVAVVKILHEMGHALACRRYGGECLEIGIMFLVFVPTLYCNVSDSWIFDSRWKRMMVSFAGMYVEICLAAAAAICWLLTPPGLINALLFNVVIVCSISTLLVNGNPLLRYDGYYLLSDWWGKPNLAGNANRAVTEFWLAGFLVPRKVFQRASGVLIYGLMSWAYRWFVVSLILIAIAWGIGRLGSYPLGYFGSGLLLAGIIVSGVVRTVRSGTSNQWQGVSIIRSTISILILTGIACFLIFVPLPGSVYCDVEVEALNPARVYAASDGQLTFIKPNFSAIRAGDEVARLENRQLSRSYQRKQEELQHHLQQLKLMRLRLNQEPELAAEMQSLDEKSGLLAAEIELISREIDSLTIIAGTSGMIVPTNELPVRFRAAATEHAWRGSINEPRNAGCYVSRGEPLLTISDPRQFLISAAVRESDMELVEKGQLVQIRFEQCPDRTVTGTIARILKQELPSARRSPESVIESYVDSKGQTRLMQSPYRVELCDVELPDQVLLGSTGRARISVRFQTAYERVSRLIRNSLAKKY